MVTTIQLNENVKKILDRLKVGRQTYEEIILNLIDNVGRYKNQQDKLLIEGCKKMAEENSKITKEFESIEDLSDWEW